MQEFEPNYPPRPVSLEEGIYFLYRLFRYGKQTDDVHEQNTTISWSFGSISFPRR